MATSGQDCEVKRRLVRRRKTTFGVDAENDVIVLSKRRSAPFDVV